MLLLLLAAFLFLRRVDTIEVVANLLFLPVFIGFVFGRIPGGIIVGLMAAGAYAALRVAAIETVGMSEYLVLIVARSFYYVVFGGVGGWANKQMQLSLTKLELFDQIEDKTGLFNARSFIEQTDLELARASRYQSIFSVVAVAFPSNALAQMSRKQEDRLLREVGRTLAGSVRNVDRVFYGFDGATHLIAIMLPETGREGSRTFASRLSQTMTEFLVQRKAVLAQGGVEVSTMVLPEDGEALRIYKERFAEIDRVERPTEQRAPS